MIEVKRLKIREMDPSIRPREKALERGIESLSDAELIALFIRTGVKGVSALDIANNVVQKCGNIQKFASLTMYDFMAISGISKIKAIELIAICEMSRRILRPYDDSKRKVNSNKELVEWLTLEIGYSMQEQFLIICLNNQNVILGYKILFIGTIDKSVVHPRDIIREAILMHACRVILVHNHPGGSLRASQADLLVTELIIDAARTVELEVCDHLIIANGHHYSLKFYHPYLFQE